MDPAFTALATEQLRRLTGNAAATFREGQLEAIEAVHVRRAKSLVVQRTGWGKSAVYFIATALNRAAGGGPTLLVSPLLALMRNQVAAAEALGLRATTVNSANVGDWAEIFARIQAGDVDLLLISPERLNNPAFRTRVLGDLVASAGLLVVDEAHCISDWGHDFRPDYRRLGQVMGQLLPNTPVLLTTATANRRVVDDIVDQLGSDLLVIRGPLDRASLRLEAFELAGRVERMAWISQHLSAFPGSGIIYTATIRDAEQLTGFLRSEGHDAVTYSGRTPDTERLEVESALAENRVKAVVATSALGMGYDKPDLRWVVHFQRPGSTVAYYQQVGRAGRAVDQAWGVLLAGEGDDIIQEYFIATAFPSPDDAARILDTITEAGGLARRDLMHRVNIQATRLDTFLKQLEVDGFVERDGNRWTRTAAPFVYPHERVDGISALRRSEVRRMHEYVTSDGCLMHFLRTDLDDETSSACGRCTRCTGKGMTRVPDPAIVERADAWALAQHPVIEPRRQWMGVTPDHLPRLTEVASESGVAFCHSDDAVWRRVSGMLRSDTGIDDWVLAAMAELVTSRLDVGSAGFLTHVPSNRPSVADAARRLARRLNLPHVETLASVGGSPQRAMENSATQQANALAKFALVAPPPATAGILFDDFVASRWTLAVCGALLRDAGATAISPVVIADTS